MSLSEITVSIHLNNGLPVRTVAYEGLGWQLGAPEVPESFKKIVKYRPYNQALTLAHANKSSLNTSAKIPCLSLFRHSYVGRNCD